VGRRGREDEHEAREPGKAAVRHRGKAPDERPQPRENSRRGGREPPLFSLTGGSFGAIVGSDGAGLGGHCLGGGLGVRGAARL
jgi:hypothetical protein